MSVFAWINDVALGPAESYRRLVTSRARGRVLEVGSGSGLNLPLYTSDVTSLVALEPDEAMWERAAPRIERAPFPVEKIVGRAKEIPLDAGSIDVAVATFVFCSIHDVTRALAELSRVVKPGGELLLLEHVTHPGRITARVQRAITPVWTKVFAGCHPGRDLAAPLRDSAWETADERFVDIRYLPRVVSHHLVGRYFNRR